MFPILRIALDWPRTDDCQISSSVRSIREGFTISEPGLINLLELSCRSTTRLGLRLECPWGIPVVHIGHDQRSKSHKIVKRTRLPIINSWDCSFQGYIPHLHGMCQLEPGIEVWAYTCDSRCSQGWTHSGTDRAPIDAFGISPVNMGNYLWREHWRSSGSQGEIIEATTHHFRTIYG